MSEELLKLAERVANGAGTDNALDVLIEIALFEPDDVDVAVRANRAGTKVIYTTRSGAEATYWANEWTADRQGAADALRAQATAGTKSARSTDFSTAKNSDEIQGASTPGR